MRVSFRLHLASWLQIMVSASCQRSSSVCVAAMCVTGYYDSLDGHPPFS